MTKTEKRASKRLAGKAEKWLFFQRLVARLDGLGRLAYWTRMYRRKCKRAEVDCPLDKLPGFNVHQPEADTCQPTRAGTNPAAESAPQDARRLDRR